MQMALRKCLSSVYYHQLQQTNTLDMQEPMIAPAVLRHAKRTMRGQTVGEQTFEPQQASLIY
jgi:hypothetical protein